MQKAWKNIYCTNYISGYSPFNIKNMNKAIERLASAINNREKIVIYQKNKNFFYTNCFTP